MVYQRYKITKPILFSFLQHSDIEYDVVTYACSCAPLTVDISNKLCRLGCSSLTESEV